MRKKNALLATASAGLLFAFLWQQLQATRLGYAIARSRAELQAQRERNAYLRTELDRLNSPERLAREARSRLGMAPPTPEALIFLGRAEEPRLVSMLGQ